MAWLDQLLALLRWKRFIFWNTTVIALASVVVALLLPKVYRAESSIFPPEDEGLALTSLSSLLSGRGLSGGRAALPMLATPSDVYSAILKSRSLRQELVRRHDLLRVYKAPDMDHAIHRLGRAVSIKVGAEGVVTVRVSDKDPERAAALANTAIELLDQINQEKRHGSAQKARIFVERRLEENRLDLRAAEDSLRSVQETTRVLVPEDQARAVIDAAAQVEVQLLLKEVELGVLEAQVGRDHPDRAGLTREVAELRSRLADIEAGRGGESTRFEIPLAEYPARTLAYLRALREVKVQEAIYELLVQQFEQYRIQETRDTPTVQILDRAIPPTVRVWPIRSLICISATVLGFLLSVLLVALLEQVARTKREAPETYESVRRVFRELGLAPLLERL